MHELSVVFTHADAVVTVAGACLPKIIAAVYVRDTAGATHRREGNLRTLRVHGSKAMNPREQQVKVQHQRQQRVKKPLQYPSQPQRPTPSRKFKREFPGLCSTDFGCQENSDMQHEQSPSRLETCGSPSFLASAIRCWSTAALHGAKLEGSRGLGQKIQRFCSFAVSA